LIYGVVTAIVIPEKSFRKRGKSQKFSDGALDRRCNDGIMKKKRIHIYRSIKVAEYICGIRLLLGS